MNKRQQVILKAIVNEYTETAEPIGSLTLVEKYKIPFSSATIRSEMAKLKEEGYIYQPHTSAGRVPTEKGYRFYIRNISKDIPLAIREKEAIEKKVRAMEDSYEKMLDSAAKVLSEVTNNAALAGIGDNLYHYGMVNLLRQPEFEKSQDALEIAFVFDHLLDLISEISFHENLNIFIGDENPIGKNANYSLVISHFDTPKSTSGYLGVLGPTRMPYERTISLVNLVSDLLEV